MTNANDPINAIVQEVTHGMTEITTMDVTGFGLTKREYFAIHATADIPLNSQTFLEETLKRQVDPKNFDSYLNDQCEALAIMKVKIADKLINELNKQS